MHDINRSNNFQKENMLADNQFARKHIKTLASRWQRLAAATIDGILLALTTWFLYAFIMPANDVPRLESINLLSFAFKGLLLQILMFFAVQGYFLHQSAQTIGKKIMNLQIISVDDTAISFQNLAIKRYLIMMLITAVPMIGSLVGLINVLFIFRDDKRCLHDLIAGTHVVQLN
jgi:uncharacterized RDD family membrane protein YckC